MKPEFIKTAFQQKKNEEVREQWWLAFLINKNYYSTQNYIHFTGSFKTHIIQEYLETLDNSHLGGINFVAITQPTEVVKESRLWHRGHETDKNPIIYRGESIGEIVYSNEYFRYYFSIHSMAPGLQNQLKSWFADQLNSYVNPNLLSYLVEQEKVDYLNRTLKQMTKLKEETDKFISEINRTMNEVQNNKKREN